jgi:hypothetical protein
MQGECQMNKKLIAIAVFVLIVALSIATIIAVAKTELVRFEVKNKKVFTVERLVYNQTTWSCGLTVSGSIDITTYMHLTFTRCDREAPNKGERGMEKVHIDDAPYGTNNRFTFIDE